MADLGTAFVQIVPSARGIEGSITNIFSGEAQSAGNATGEAMGDSMLGGLNLALIAGAAAVVGTVTAIASEAWQVVNEVAEYGDTIDKQSQMMSLSTQAYQELSFAAERSGTSIGSFRRGIRNITNDLADFANGSAGASDKYDALGVSLRNTDGSMRNSEEVLYDTLYALADMEDITQRNAEANDIFGRSYEELLPLLNSGSDGIEELFGRFNELNGAMSEEGVAASAGFEDAMTNLHTAVQGVKNELAESGLLGRFTDWINAAADWVASDHPVLERAFETLTGAIDDAAEGVDGLSYAFESLSGVTDKLDYIFAPITEKFHQFKQQIIDDFNELEPGLGTAGMRAMEALAGGMSSKLNLFGNIAGAISAVIQGDTAALQQYTGNLGISAYVGTAPGNPYPNGSRVGTTIRQGTSSTGRSTTLRAPR